MLKHRIIQVLLTDGNGSCVKPISFQRPYRKLGTMEQYLNVVERRNVDELIIIDIEATNEKRKPDFNKLSRYCSNIYCPVSYGGGISTLDDIRDALNSGADKVVIETHSEIIEEASEKFGKQAIVGVANFDFPTTWEECSKYCKYLEDCGAGEIIVTSIPLDGRMERYSTLLIETAVKNVNIPVIALGGCGEPAHMHQALLVGASAVAAGSMFLFAEHTPRSCAKYLEEQGIPVRI